jgi:acetylornithine deacetylase/succinyl-diaminopimelate desuccinylase-like protein
LKEIDTACCLQHNIRGSNDDKAENVLPPYMLAAKMDVVPVVANGRGKWLIPLNINDGVICGRGALDDKSSVANGGLTCYIFTPNCALSGGGFFQLYFLMASA